MPDYPLTPYRKRLLQLHADLSRRLLEKLRDEAEGSLHEFLRQAWPYFDPAAFIDNWHLQAISEHLEAVSFGQIKRLVVNIPPRHAKTSLITVCWPCWTWAQKPERDYPLIGPQVTFLCGSYGANKAQSDGLLARRLIASEWYQKNWSARVKIAKDRDNQEQYDTSAGGSRINTGIPESLGKGGLIRILDDPHKTDEVESQAMRQKQVKAYDEVWRTRSNDATQGAEVLVMQRLAEDDLTGHILEEDGVVHLCLPALYEADRRCSTVLGWSDPRENDGEPLWQARFSETYLRAHERGIGPYAFASQYQQRPQPRGGGIIKTDWWQPYDKKKADVSYIIAGLDTAMTTAEESDYSAMVVFGSWQASGSIVGDEIAGYDFVASNDPREGRASAARTPITLGALPKVLMMHAWKDRVDIERLVDRVLITCAKYKVDTLVIENKTHGHAVNQTLMNMFASKPFDVVMYDPNKNRDKSARLYSVQHLFSEGLIYAPGEWEDGSWLFKEWADMVIQQVAQFPRGAHDDLVDCVSMALQTLRSRGFAPRKDEVVEHIMGMVRHKPQTRVLYDA